MIGQIKLMRNTEYELCWQEYDSRGCIVIRCGVRGITNEVDAERIIRSAKTIAKTKNYFLRNQNVK